MSEQVVCVAIGSVAVTFLALSIWGYARALRFQAAADQARSAPPEWVRAVRAMKAWQSNGEDVCVTVGESRARSFAMYQELNRALDAVDDRALATAALAREKAT